MKKKENKHKTNKQTNTNESGKQVRPEQRRE
jgi:hypothetical protein